MFRLLLRSNGGGALVRKQGFALPTVLLSSIMMIMILVTAVSVTTSVSNGLRDQRYTELASLAADAGTVMATACLTESGGQAHWTSVKPLKPDTACTSKKPRVGNERVSSGMFRWSPNA